MTREETAYETLQVAKLGLRTQASRESLTCVSGGESLGQDSRICALCADRGVQTGPRNSDLPALSIARLNL